jgi:hypothetical protein
MVQRILISLIGLYSLTLSGCSIAMALHGNPEPNFEAFEVGSTRKQVELQLGTPVSSKALTDGKREDTYRYEMGNSPNGGRAAMNLYLDLATFGIWELPGSIVEASMGHREESRIIYGPDHVVLEIHGYRPPEPSPELKAAQEAHEKYKQPGSP